MANKAGMDNLPPVQGLMSYRKDNAKLYVTDGQGWEALGKEKQVHEIRYYFYLRLKTMILSKHSITSARRLRDLERLRN